MKIAVTGALGFLGRHLCPALEQAGHEVVRVDLPDYDLRRSAALDALPAAAFDQIYHLAAWTRAGDFCRRHPGEQWIVNQQLNTHVLAWWQERQPQAKLMAMGSSGCYAPESDLVEENYLAGQPVPDLFAYAMTKRMLYIGLETLRRQYGRRYLCLSPSTLYGPGYPLDGRPMHFIYDLIRKIAAARYEGAPVELWGDGSQVRELVLARDFVAAALALAASADNELVNIGAGAGQTIRWFAEQVCAAVGYDPARIRYDPARAVGAPAKVLNTAKLRRLWPAWAPTPPEQGVREVVAWYLREKGYA